MSIFVRYFLVIIGLALLITVITFFIWKPTTKTTTPPKTTPSTIATTDGGILVSSDGGASWKTLSGSAGVSPLMIVGKNGSPSTFYVGTKNQGLWILKGAEASLEQVKDPKGVLDPASQIDAIAQTADGTTLYLGVYQKEYGYIMKLNESSVEIIYKTPLKGYGVFGIIVDPRDSAHVNASIGDGSFIETRDAGRTKYWSVITRTKQGIVRLFHNPEKPNTFWGLGNKNLLYMSDTSGQSWKELPAITVDKKKLSVITGLEYVPTRHELFASTEYGLINSADNGNSWHAFHTPVPPLTITATAFATHPNFEEVFWFAAGNQIFRTDDGGESWRGTVLPTEKSISMLYVDTSNPKKIYAGLTK